MAKIYLTDSSSNTNSRNWSIGNGGSAYGNLTLSVSAAKNGNAGDNTAINVMMLTPSGNVGIGTTSPGEKLDVNGNVKVGARLAMTPSVFGYSSGWKTLILGSSGTDYTTNATTITFGVDLSTNPSGSYTGNGGEIFFRNQVSFGTPNAANDGYLYPMVFNNGTVYFPAGNVGIGTTSPNAQLNITKTFNASAGAQLNPTGGASVAIDYQTTNDIQGRIRSRDWDGATWKNLTFEANNIILSPVGNVGIGTTAPIEQLQLTNKQFVQGGVQAWNTTIQGTTRGSIHIGAASATANAGGAITFGARDSSSGVGAQAGIYTNTDGAYGTRMYFSTSNSYSTGAQTRMTILENGNIGVGTTGPGAKLDVNGEIFASSNVQIGAAGLAGKYYIRRPSDGSASAYFGYTSADNTDFGVYNGSGGGSIKFNSNNGIFQFNNLATGELVRITSAGNVGIGTTSPAVALDVNGTINGGFLTINRAGTSAIFTDTRTNIHTTTPSFKVQNTGDTSVTTLSHRLVDLDYAGDADTVTGTYVRFLTGGTERAGLGLTSDKFTITTGVAERLTIDSTGNVGIGTTSPNVALEVSGASNLSSRIRAAKTSSGTIEMGADRDTFGSPYISAITNSNLDFFTNDTHRIRITNAGNVIINGTTAINSASNRGNLTINGTSAILNLGISNVESGYIFHNGTNLDISQVLAQPLRFLTTNAERMRITSAGNVGIGTTSPNRKLYVVSSDWDNVTGGGVIFENSNTVGASLTLKPSASVVTNGSNGWAVYAGGPGAAISDGNLGFWAHGTNEARMVIQRGGSVGIGTTSPGVKLDVVGTASLTGTAGASFRAVQNQTNYRGVVLGYDTSGQIGIIYPETNSPASTLAIWTYSGSAWGERMRINGSGNVGIGTTSPGRKLTVQGADDATMQLRLMGTASQNSYWEIGREALSTGQFRFIASRSGTVITPMVIDDQTGNVGIGTTSPNQRLDVRGFIVSDSQSTGSESAFYLGNSAHGLSRANSQNDIVLYTTNGDVKISGNTASTTHLIVKNSGNVLIGTTTDSGYKLNVVGEVSFSPNTAGKNTFTFTTNAANDARLLLKSDTTTKVDIQANGATYFNGGSVGIGTTSPITKLDVLDGTIAAGNSTNVSQTNTLFQGYGYFIGSTRYGLVGLHSTYNNANNRSTLDFYTTGSTGYNQKMSISTEGVVRLNTYGSGGITGTPTYNLAVDANGDIIELPGGVVDGSGTANQLARWQDANTLTSAGIEDNGSAISIGRDAFYSATNYGTAYSSVTGASGGTAWFDTVTASSARLYNITIFANPNSSGSGSYKDFYYGKIIVGNGYNGSAVVDFINYHQESPQPRSLYDSGGGNLTVTAVFVYGGSEVTEVPSGATYIIRIKISGYNNAGAGTQINLQRIM
jgi:hypothetical protein